MLLWETQIKYNTVDTKEVGIHRLEICEDSERPMQEWDNLLRELNKMLGYNCDPQNCISVYILGGTQGCLDAIIAHPIKTVSPDYCLDHIRSTLEKNYAVCGISFEGLKEISGKRFDYLGEKADDNGYIRRWHSERIHLGIDYFANNQFKVEEYMEETSQFSHEEAMDTAGNIMADSSLYEELDRIYSDENEKHFYGNPVHYKISASNSKSALDIIDVMIPSLLTNKRICGKRILHIHDISSGCYDEKDFEHLFESAQGHAVVLEMCGTDEENGNFASSYTRVVEYIDSVITRFHLNTLCFFVEVMDHPGFSESLLARVSETIHIINIREGVGNRDQAGSYLKKLVQKENFEISDEQIEQLLDDKNSFSVNDIYNIYNSWYKNGLCTRFYKAYSNYRFDCLKLPGKTGSPYDELQRMTGLTGIKGLVDEIIDTARINKVRSRYGLKNQKASLHMVFTGNPGTAKTTVARLIGQILSKEGILEDGNFVECGRADLIAKYVGWTAKNVRSKFREVRGGVLFIDEAYSLVDESHSFADEAISTIVQEMENHREDVLVIFAGYPEKMKDFLEKNEGLKSRIAFHLDFPDYTPDELTDILKLMVQQHNYKIEDEAIEKCHDIFRTVSASSDFGNGRFVRNLLEHAEMAQSHRLASVYNGKKLSKKILQTLTAEDFDQTPAMNEAPPRRKMGFAV